MKRSLLLIWSGLLLFLSNSCNLDNLDFSKLSRETNLSPEFVAPLAKANITVWDLVQSANTGNNDVITLDANKLIKIVSRQENLYHYNVRDFLDFPKKPNDKVRTSFNITLNNLVDLIKPQLDGIRQFDGTSQSFPAVLFSGPAVNFINDEPVTDFTTITLSKGNLEIILENKMKVPITITGSLFDAFYNKTIKEFTFKNILPGKSANDPLFSLRGVQLSNQVEFHLNSLQTSGSSTPVLIKLSDYFKLDFNITDIEFQSITGDFGKRSVQVEGMFDLNVDLLDKIDGSFKLANPKLELTIRNPIGIPATIDFKMTATNKTNTVVLTRTPSTFDIPVPSKINETATGTYVFDKDNSNIIPFIALPPTGQIKYSGKVDFNTNPVSPQNLNFLGLNTTFDIDLLVELPLELKTSNLAFKDTSSISGGDFDKLESAELIVNAKNGIPLDIDLQLLFIDTIVPNKQYGTSKITKILAAAQVSASGVITPVQSSQTFILDKSEMENLRKANGLVFIGRVSSPDSGTKVAQLYADSKIEMNVVIKSKVNL